MMTHKERRARRAEIAAYAREHDYRAAAAHFNVTISTVYNAMKLEPGPSCHEKSRDRRREIALYVAEHGKQAAVEHFQISISTVNVACYENGVISESSPKAAGIRSLQIVKLLLDGLSMSDIARQFNVSRQYVHIMKNRAEKAGFTFKEQTDGQD